MLKLSRLADYSVQILSCLSLQHEGLLTAKEVSAKAQIPLPTVSKLLKLLVKNDLLLSVQGVRGGYRLAKPAEDLNIIDVVQAVDGPISLMNCSGKDHHACAPDTICPTKANYQRINDAVTLALSSVKISDIAGPPCLVHQPTNSHTEEPCTQVVGS